MSDDQWHSWIYVPPYGQEVIEIMRDEWIHPELVKPGDLHPMFNFEGLRWRPWRPH